MHPKQLTEKKQPQSIYKLMKHHTTYVCSKTDGKFKVGI